MRTNLQKTEKIIKGNSRKILLQGKRRRFQRERKMIDGKLKNNQQKGFKREMMKVKENSKTKKQNYWKIGKIGKTYCQNNKLIKRLFT